MQELHFPLALGTYVVDLLAKQAKERLKFDSFACLLYLAATKVI